MLAVTFSVFFLQNDRVEATRKSEIGKIKVVRKIGRFVKEEYRPIKEVKFSQATKKDAHSVTGGSYTMSTTRKGKYLSRTRPYDVKLKKLWQIDSVAGSLNVNYRMGHSLEEMGVKLEHIDWSQCNRRTLSTASEPSSDTSSENSIIDEEPEEDQLHHYLLTTNVDNIKKQPLDEDLDT